MPRPKKDPEGRGDPAIARPIRIRPDFVGPARDAMFAVAEEVQPPARGNRAWLPGHDRDEIWCDAAVVVSAHILPELADPPALPTTAGPGTDGPRKSAAPPRPPPCRSLHVRLALEAIVEHADRSIALEVGPLAFGASLRKVPELRDAMRCVVDHRHRAAQDKGGRGRKPPASIAALGPDGPADRGESPEDAAIGAEVERRVDAAIAGLEDFPRVVIDLTAAGVTTADISRECKRHLHPALGDPPASKVAEVRLGRLEESAWAGLAVAPLEAATPDEHTREYQRIYRYVTKVQIKAIADLKAEFAEEVEGQI